MKSPSRLVLAIRKFFRLLAWLLTWRREDWRVWRQMSTTERQIVRAGLLRPSVVGRRGTYSNAQDSIEGHWRSVVEPHVRQVVTQINLESNRRAIDDELAANARWQAEIQRRQREGRRDA